MFGTVYTYPPPVYTYPPSVYTYPPPVYTYPPPVYTYPPPRKDTGLMCCGAVVVLFNGECL